MAKPALVKVRRGMGTWVSDELGGKGMDKDRVPSLLIPDLEAGTSSGWGRLSEGVCTMTKVSGSSSGILAAMIRVRASTCFRTSDMKPRLALNISWSCSGASLAFWLNNLEIIPRTVSQVPCCDCVGQNKGHKATAFRIHVYWTKINKLD